MFELMIMRFDVLLELLGPDESRGAGAVADEGVLRSADETVVSVSRPTERLRADADRVVRFVARERCCVV